MIFPYLEQFKEYLTNGKNKKRFIGGQDDLDSFTVLRELSNCKTTTAKSTKDDQPIKSNQIRFRPDLNNSLDSDDSTVYENSFDYLNEKSNCIFSRSVLTFKSSSSTPIKPTNNQNSTLNNSSTFSPIYKANRIKSPINHQCIESKVIRTKVNQSQNVSKVEQKCIHQMHPECLNLSNSNEGCLVCNALVSGREVTMRSFKEVPPSKDESKKGLAHELNKISKCGWYWGPIRRVDAEEKLRNEENGTFLIRDSFDANYVLSLSFKIKEGVFHTRIEYTNQLFSFYLQPNKQYETVSKLVDDLILISRTGIHYYVRSKKTNKEMRFLIKLDKTLNRLDKIPNLKHLCRFTIKQSIRFDLIEHLPLPDYLKQYLKENHY